MGQLIIKFADGNPTKVGGELKISLPENMEKSFKPKKAIINGVVLRKKIPNYSEKGK